MVPSHLSLRDLMNVIQAKPLFSQKSLQKDLWGQMELRQTPNRDMRRYERPHINEVWCGDSSVGPRLTMPDGKKHRIYIIALIDDASRFITGIDVFYNDNFINLMSVMRAAIAKYARP